MVEKLRKGGKWALAKHLNFRTPMGGTETRKVRLPEAKEATDTRKRVTNGKQGYQEGTAQ